MNAISCLLMASVISYIAYGGILEDEAAAIGETCNDCYRIKCTGDQPDPASKTTTFIYEVSVGVGCDNLGEISLGFDNNCGRSVSEMQSSLSFDFDEPGNSGPTITMQDITIYDVGGNPDKILEINIDLKKKIQAGETKEFRITAGPPGTGIPGPGQTTLDHRTKQSNSDDCLVGFKSVNGQQVDTCYTDVTLRLFPEICKDGRDGPKPQKDDDSCFPPPSPGSPPPKGAPGAFERCQGDINGNDQGVCPPDAECAGQLDAKDGDPCSPPYSELTGCSLDGAVCIVVREEQPVNGCSTDSDCDSQDRCYTLLGAINSNTAECTEKVCGSSNLS